MAKKTLEESLSSSTMSKDMQSTLEKMVKNHDALNNALDKEYESLTNISDQYSKLSELSSIFAESQADILMHFDDQKDKVEDLNKMFDEMVNTRKKLLNYQKEESDILSGASRIQARLSAEYSKHVEMANEWKKTGSTMFAPSALQPFMKALDSLNSKLKIPFTDFSTGAYKMRQMELQKQRQRLIEEGKTDQLAMLEWSESTSKKVFDTIEGTLKTLWEVGSFVFSKLFGHLKRIFNSLMDMGKKFLDFFTKIPDTLLTITKSAFTFQKVTMEYIQNLSQSIIAIPLNILEKAQELGYEIKKEISEFAQAYENLQKDFKGGSFIGKGLKNIHNDLISARKEFMNVNTEAVHLFGRGIQGINKALGESGEIVKSLGVFSSIFANQIIKNKDNLFYYYKMKQTFNLADDDMQYLARQATVTGKSIATVYDQIEKSITGAADIHHQDAKQMSRDYFDMRKNVIDFGHISNRELGNIVARTRQMGVEVKEAAGMFQKLQTFEDAANMASQLSQGFNMVVDSMALLKAESPDQVLQMLRDSMFATGRSFNQMNRFEKSLLQQQTGLSAEAMQALFEYQNLGKSYEEIMQEMEAKDPTKLQLKSMQDLKDAVVEMKEVMPKFQNSFEAFFSGLKDNILLSSDLRNNLSALSFSFDDLYQAGLSSSMKQFLPALNAISTVIGNIKNTLTDSKFISSMTKITISVTKIVDSLFSMKGKDISGDITNIINEIEPLFKKLFDMGFDIIKAGLNTFIGSLPNIFKLLANQINNFFGPQGFFIAKLLPTLKNVSTQLVSTISGTNFQKDIINSFKTIFKFSSEFIKIGADIAKSLLKGIVTDLSGGATGSVILKEFKGLINSIFDMLIGRTSAQNRRSGGLIKQILGFDSNGKLQLGSASSIIRGVWDTLYPIMVDVTKELSYLLVDLTDWLNKTLSDIAKDENFFNSLLENDDWSKIIDNIGKVLTNIIGADGSSGIIGSIYGVLNKFINYLSTVKIGGKSFTDLFMTAIGKIFEMYYGFYKALYTMFLKDFITQNMDKIIAGISLVIGYIGMKMMIGAKVIQSSIASGGQQHAAILTAAFTNNINMLSTSFIRAGSVVAQQIAAAMGRASPGIPDLGTIEPGSSQSKTTKKAGRMGRMGRVAGGMGTAAIIAAPMIMQAAAGGDVALGSSIGGMVGGTAGAALGTFLGGPVGTVLGGMIGSSIGTYAGSYFDDGFISKDGKIIKIHDNDNVVAFKEDGPVLNSSGKISDMINKNNRSEIDIKALTNEMSTKIKEAVQVAIVEGFKSQNQVIEVKLNGEKVGEGLLASGFTNMMSNANKTKGNPTINPNAVIYRDGQIPSSGYINS